MATQCPKCQSENPDTAKFCSECATPLQPSKDISITKTIETPVEEYPRGSTFADRYKIIEKLGTGGMGTVYRVEDTNIGQDIALKLIKPGVASDKKTIERFRNELKTARMISHRNVCRMFDLTETDGTYYITMEYVPGEDLKSFIRRSGKLDIPKAISITKEICEGLAEAHRLGVVHRDLKSNNIMIDKEGNARIMDFGIARSMTTQGMTGEGIIIGTPEYMSPEQAEAKGVDHRSDIYSLGVILYEMVTGELPFEGDTPLSVAMKHKGEMPKDPKALNPQIQEDFNSLILNCLQKDRDKRYQSAEEMRSELENIEKSIPTSERIIQKRKQKLAKISKTKLKKGVLYAGAVGISVLLIVGILWITGGRKTIDSIAVMPFEFTSDDPEMEYLCDGITENIINNLSQLPGLKRVIARSSVIQYKNKKIIPQVVGQELGVDAVLISQVTRREDKLSISTELVKAGDNSRIWGHQYNHLEPSELLDIKGEISRAIADNLHLNLTNEAQVRLTKRYTYNASAHQLYLKGLFFWNTRKEEGLKKGLEYFQQAIEQDPDFALAYVGLANTYIVLLAQNRISLEEAAQKGRAAAFKALEIDQMLGEAHTSLAYLEFCCNWNWEATERGFKRAIELNPGYATAHQWYSDYFAAVGRLDDAIIEAKRALELDPLSLVINFQLGHMLIFDGKYELAIEQSHKMYEMFPDSYIPHFLLGYVYLQQGFFKDAVAELEKAKVISKNRPFYSALLGNAYAASGDKEAALKEIEFLKAISKTENVNPESYARIYMGLEDIDKTLFWLEKGFDERDYRLLMIKVQPIYKTLRDEPKFKAILKKMNLE